MVQQSKHQTQIRVLLSKYSTSFFCHLNLINFLFVFLCLPIQKLLHPLKKRSSSSVTLAINSSSIMSMICSSLVQLSNSFPRDCVPKSCGINRQFCVFDDVYSGVFEVITDRESWTWNRGGPWRRGCKAFLSAVPGSNISDTVMSHVNNIFCDQSVDCFG